MRDLASVLIQEKNRQFGHPWVVLLEIVVPDGSSTVLYLAQYDAPFDFGGNTYTPFPFVVGEIKENNRGSLESVMVTCANVSREMQGILEQYDGLIGTQVYIKVVNTEQLGNPLYTLSDGPYEVKSCTCDEQHVQFNVGMLNILQKPLPRNRFDRNKCLYAYAGTRCGWTVVTGLDAAYPDADAVKCDHTLSGANGCRAHNNRERYGGFPGLPGVRSFM